jgi:hypothetical protein
VCHGYTRRTRLSLVGKTRPGTAPVASAGHIKVQNSEWCLRFSDQQSPIRNLEHRSKNILIDLFHLHASHSVALPTRITRLPPRAAFSRRLIRIFEKTMFQIAYRLLIADLDALLLLSAEMGNDLASEDIGKTRLLGPSGELPWSTRSCRTRDTALASSESRCHVHCHSSFPRFEQSLIRRAAVDR